MNEKELIAVLADCNFNSAKWKAQLRIVERLKYELSLSTLTLVQSIRLLFESKQITSEDILGLLELRFRCNNETHDLDIEHAKLVRMNHDHYVALKNLINLKVGPGKPINLSGMVDPRDYPDKDQAKLMGGLERMTELLIYDFIENLIINEESIVDRS